MFGRSNDASVFKVLTGMIVFVVVWALFGIAILTVPALMLRHIFGVVSMETFLVIAAYAYPVGMSVSVFVLLALRHKRRYLDRMRKKCGPNCAFKSGESKGFVSVSSNVIGVLAWPFTWITLLHREEEVAELLTQWFGI